MAFTKTRGFLLLVLCVSAAIANATKLRGGAAPKCGAKKSIKGLMFANQYCFEICKDAAAPLCCTMGTSTGRCMAACDEREHELAACSHASTVERCKEAIEPQAKQEHEEQHAARVAKHGASEKNRAEGHKAAIEIVNSEEQSEIVAPEGATASSSSAAAAAAAAAPALLQLGGGTGRRLTVSHRLIILVGAGQWWPQFRPNLPQHAKIHIVDPHPSEAGQIEAHLGNGNHGMLFQGTYEEYATQLGPMLNHEFSEAIVISYTAAVLDIPPLDGLKTVFVYQGHGGEALPTHAVEALDTSEGNVAYLNELNELRRQVLWVQDHQPGYKGEEGKFLKPEIIMKYNSIFETMANVAQHAVNGELFQTLIDQLVKRCGDLYSYTMRTAVKSHVEVVHEVKALHRTFPLYKLAG